ncbi:MAG: hypothetical protein Q7J73_07980 [Dehalococcoidales bacterium]|nr:hypothetical protein [Dehalococcoidales bacterium]
MTASEIYVPEEVAKLLVKDEEINSQFPFYELMVFTSKYRVFLDNGKKVKDVSYSSISSVEVEEKTRWDIITWGLLFWGILIIFTLSSCVNLGNRTALGYLLTETGIAGSLATLGIFICAISLMVFGLKRKNNHVRLNIAGIPQGIILKGDKDITDNFLRRVNDGRFQSSNKDSH